jgi:hypothetical protein
MAHFPILRDATRVLAWTGLAACAACAAVSGLDRIEESECFAGCDAGVDPPRTAVPEAAVPVVDVPADAAEEPMPSPTAEDAGLPKAPDASDAGRETAAPFDAGSDAPPATFCSKLSPPALFCDDFDEGALSGWSYVHTMYGTVALDKTEFKSSPGAMITQSGATSAPSVADVAAYRTFPSTGQAFAGAIELDLRVDRADASGANAVLAQINFVDASGTGSYFLQLVPHSNGSAPFSIGFNEVYFGPGSSGMPVIHSVSQTIALATWTHVKLAAAIPIAGGSGTATLALNGTQVATCAISVPVKNFSTAIGAGVLWASNPSTGWTAVYDNVTFNATGN